MASDAEIQNISLLQRLAAQKAVVEFADRVGKYVDGYAEPGMRARLIDFSYSGKFESYLALFDFSEFEEYNRAFEAATFRGAEGQPPRTARQAGLYKAQNTMYLDLDDLGSMLTILPSTTTALVERFAQDGGGFGSYMAWLEHHAAASLGLTDNAVAETSPVPGKR